MPFDNNNTDSGDHMLKWLTARLDRLERLIDDLNAKITSMEHHLLFPQRMDVTGWNGALVIVGVISATIFIIWLIYVGGQAGG